MPEERNTNSPNDRTGEWTSERRYLTIAFCDIVGSSALFETHDPEAVRGILDRFQSICIEVVKWYGGTVVSSAGDGVLFQFGFPRAHGNDAERAIRASLAIVDRVRSTDFSSDLVRVPSVHARVGLSSGLVLVSPERTETWQISHNLIGEAVNLACRLQALAATDGVLASHETVEIVGGLFEALALGPQQLKGFKRLIHVSRISAQKVAADRSSPRFDRGSIRVVGRNTELSLLRQAWQDVVQYRSPKTVLVCGEPGVGKSRLIEEFRQSLDPATSFAKLNCFEISAATPLHPVLSYLRSAAGTVPADTAASAAEKVDNLLGTFGIRGEVEVHLMRCMLGLEPFDETKLGAVPPRHRKRVEFELLLGLFERLLGSMPCVLFLDDEHWIDPSSGEFLGLLLERFAGKPFLLLLASRREPENIARERYSSMISLAPLNLPDRREVLNWMPGSDQLDPETAKQIVYLSDGIPFYLEELTIAALERRSLVVTREPSSSPGKYEVPLALAELLSERLDNVSAMRTLLRAMSALGGPTSPRILALALQESQDEVKAKLAVLIKEGVAIRIGEGSDEAYDYRHVLLSRVCYSGMVHAIRHETHQRVVAALLADTSSPPAIEVLAHHLDGAAMYERAAEAWLKAGSESAKRSANVEAITSLRNALEAIGKIGNTPGRIQLELLARVSLVGPFVAVKGFCASEVFDCCSAGLALCEQHPSPYVFPFLYARFTWEITSGYVQAALRTAQAFLQLAIERNYQPGETIGFRLLGMALFANARPGDAEQALSTSIDRYDPGVDSSVTYLFGANSKITGQALLSLVLYYTGRTEAAVSLGDETLRQADELRHPLSTGIAISYIGGFIAAYNGETEQVIAHSRRLISFSAENNLRVFQLFGEFFLGWASFQSGRLISGLQMMCEATEEMASIGWKLSVPSMLALYAEALIAAGKTTEARQHCEQAKAMIVEGGETWGEPEVLRVEALAIHCAAPEQAALAEELVSRSAALARERHSPTFERRALEASERIFDGQEGRLAEFRQRLMEIAGT
ncbi:hypothetical protein N182_37905 [Sinorhizobium sp. GL2]|nr:hypothetical protein N182_37905 [Sinorhizobium sp. GL2]